MGHEGAILVSPNNPHLQVTQHGELCLYTANPDLAAAITNRKTYRAPPTLVSNFYNVLNSPSLLLTGREQWLSLTGSGLRAMLWRNKRERSKLAVQEQKLAANADGEFA